MTHVELVSPFVALPSHAAADDERQEARRCFLLCLRSRLAAGVAHARQANLEQLVTRLHGRAAVRAWRVAYDGQSRCAASSGVEG